MRIAVVGAGWAGGVHATAYAGMKDVEIAAIVGKGRPRARALARKMKAPSTTDLASVLNDDTIDAVDVCIPSGLHRKVAVPALEGGKHVLLETPIALTLEDADAILSAAKRHRRIVAVAQTMKFVVPNVLIHDAVTKGTVGAVRFVHAARLSRPYWSPEKPRDFRVYGDPMLELMIFEYETLDWLLGSPRKITATGVRGRSGAIEQAVVTLSYDRCVAVAEGSAMMPRTWPFTTYLRVQGEAGAMEVRDRFVSGDDPETSFLRYPLEGAFEEVPFEGQDPYFAECHHFLRSVEGKADAALIGGDAGREALRVALAAKDAIGPRPKD